MAVPRPIVVSPPTQEQLEGPLLAQATSGQGQQLGVSSATSSEVVTTTAAEPTHHLTTLDGAIDGVMAGATIGGQAGATIGGQAGAQLPDNRLDFSPVLHQDDHLDLAVELAQHLDLVELGGVSYVLLCFVLFFKTYIVVLLLYFVESIYLLILYTGKILPLFYFRPFRPLP